MQSILTYTFAASNKYLSAKAISVEYWDQETI